MVADFRHAFSADEAHAARACLHSISLAATGTSSGRLLALAQAPLKEFLDCFHDRFIPLRACPEGVWSVPGRKKLSLHAGLSEFSYHLFGLPIGNRGIGGAAENEQGRQVVVYHEGLPADCVARLSPRRTAPPDSASKTNQRIPRSGMGGMIATPECSPHPSGVRFQIRTCSPDHAMLCSAGCPPIHAASDPTRKRPVRPRVPRVRRPRAHPSSSAPSHPIGKHRAVVFGFARRSFSHFCDEPTICPSAADW